MVAFGKYCKHLKSATVGSLFILPGRIDFIYLQFINGQSLFTTIQLYNNITLNQTRDNLIWPVMKVLQITHFSCGNVHVT